MKHLYLSSNISHSAKQIAKQTQQSGKRLLFIATAAEKESGDLAWFKADRAALEDAGFLIDEFTITGKSLDDIQQALDNHDIVYVSGGNGLYLLQQIQQTGCAQLLRDFVISGRPYIGSSAGSYITAPNIFAAYTEAGGKNAPLLDGFEALGIVDFMVLPHWGSDSFRPVYFGGRLEHMYDIDCKYILLNDDQYIQVQDDFYKIIDVDK